MQVQVLITYKQFLSYCIEYFVETFAAYVTIIYSKNIVDERVTLWTALMGMSAAI